MKWFGVQVSEDHCWIVLDPEGGREASVEVTTDNAPKRGLPAGEAAWQGWLYSGGHATLCSQQVRLGLICSLQGGFWQPQQQLPCHAASCWHP